MEKAIVRDKFSSITTSQSLVSNSSSTGKIAVKLENVSVAYKLYNHPKDRLREALHPFRKKYHRDFYALKDINLVVKKGEILGIVGKNGSGKSTLLKIVSNIMQPTSGIVQVNGALSAILELGGGFNPDFTGIENVYFYGSILGYTRKDMNEKIGEIIEFADIGDFIYQPIKTYSTGMIARLAFAVATAIEPEIIVLDEVLAVGDELFRRKCFARMEKFMQGEKTVFFVSHALDSVNQVCTRAILLDRGKLILEGPPKMVTSYYQKLIFSKKEDEDNIRLEIMQLNKDEEFKKRIKKEIEENKTKSMKQKQLERKDENQKDSEKTKSIIEQKPFYLPGLKPKSTIRYKNYDVDIYDVKIIDNEGKQVNHLVINDVYEYCLRIKSNIDVEDVAVGLDIKDVTGYKISSVESLFIYKSGNYIRRLNRGDELVVKFIFKCILRPGIYFTNNGISSFKNGQQVILDRSEDIYAFKVLDKNTYNRGPVDLFERIEMLVSNTNEKITLFVRDGF